MNESRLQRWKASGFAVVGMMLTTCLPGSSALTQRNACLPQNTDRRSGEEMLRVGLNSAGLSALSYRSQSLLRSAKSGALQPVNASPVLRKSGGNPEVGTGTPSRSRFDAAQGGVTRNYDWGIVRAQYARRKASLTVRLSITNTSRVNTITRLDLQLAELTFPGVPQGNVLDAGQFGLGKPHPLCEYPLFASGEAMPPIIDIRYGKEFLLFCSDNPAAPVAIGVAGSSNRPTNTAYPLLVSFGAIAPGQSAVADVSLRFGPADASAKTLAGDVLTRYAKRYPYQLVWRDRRAIAGLMLASVGKHTIGNPRGWFNNAPDIDVMTEAGLAHFRVRLLAYADDSMRELKAANAQGMITWDVEGQEVDAACYYGDPRLTEQVAPETAYRWNEKLACLDEYFQKFRDAGFRVGVCIRPQQIRFVNGVPKQEDVADPEQVLKAKIAYARRRWGCTLFYLDSTVDNKAQALNADIFKHLADANRDVLLIPENETLRDYAYTAPLNSFQHHSVTSTPTGARLVYPQAFSILLAMEGDYARHFNELVASVRRGDILLFRGWFADPNNAVIKRIYDAAAKP